MKNKTETTDKVTKEELQFVPIEKEPCDTCKDVKEIKLPNYTREEMDFAMTIVDRMDISREQQEFLVSLNNRVNNDNKRMGCGKCMIQVIRNIKNAYTRLYSNE